MSDIDGTDSNQVFLTNVMKKKNNLQGVPLENIIALVDVDEKLIDAARKAWNL